MGTLTLKSYNLMNADAPGSHHAELRLRLLNHVLLLRLADAGENPRLRVVVQHVALETGEEVAEAADAAQAHHTLAEKQKTRFRWVKTVPRNSSDR